MLIKPAYAISLSDWYTPGKALGNNPTIGGILSPLINNLLIVSGLFAFFVIIFAGFNYITGGGDKAKMTQAQNMLTYAIIGLVLVVSAYVITNIIFNIIGFKFI